VSEEKEKCLVYNGIKEINKAESELDFQIEEIERNGFTIIESVLSNDETCSIGLKMDEVYRKQIDDIGGEDKLWEIGDSDSVKHLMAYDEAFVSLLRHVKVLPIVRHFLKDYFVLNLQNGILNKPNVWNPASLWHRDLFFQHYTSSRPLSISALFSIDDFTAEMGGTYVLPGSHRHESFPSPGYAQKFEQQLVVKAGSVIIFDSMMFHRAGFNGSSKVRRSISNIYTLPFIRQQISLPRVLKGKYSDDDFLRKLLGYDSDPADHVDAWRKERLEVREGKGYHPGYEVS
jgi:ectoine hydroxylase-related dioxygenase (phytanoyl-CoA dioxygenase family)